MLTAEAINRVNQGQKVHDNKVCFCFAVDFFFPSPHTYQLLNINWNIFTKANVVLGLLVTPHLVPSTPHQKKKKVIWGVYTDILIIFVCFKDLELKSTFLSPLECIILSHYRELNSRRWKLCHSSSNPSFISKWKERLWRACEGQMRAKHFQWS